MANQKMSKEQTDEITRAGIKSLIKKYNESKGQDVQTLAMLLEQIGKTPMYFALEKGSPRSGDVRFMTLQTGGQSFIPMFTSQKELGRLDGLCDCVLFDPLDSMQMLADSNHHAVVNPFSGAFLMWPELIREHMLPYMKKAEKEKERAESGEIFTPFN